MDLNEFWNLIDRARADAVASGLQWPAGPAVGDALVNRLVDLPREQIPQFDHCLAQATAQADTWEVCAAAAVISGFVSDDSFLDFKTGLVALGRQVFERACADPDSLADHPMIQAVAAGSLPEDVLVGEAIEYAASEAYERITNDHDAYSAVSPDDDDAESAWSGEFDSVEEAEEIRTRLPRLSALFRPVG